jgi:hypothetical protein
MLTMPPLPTPQRTRTSSESTCPLGWPDDFLLFLQEHYAGHVVAPQEVAGRDWRRKLA